MDDESSLEVSGPDAPQSGSFASGAARRSSEVPAQTQYPIGIRQNEKWSLQLLAAQRQLYSEAKNWRRLRAWSTALVAVGGVGAAMFWPQLSSILGPTGAIIGVVAWAEKFIEKRHARIAASIQEEFDTRVFGLEWNAILVSKVGPEEVVAATSRFKGDPTELADWYTIPAGVPRPLDVLLCQRSNLRWDATLRQAYADHVLRWLAALAVGIAALGLVRQLSLQDFLLAALPSVGAFMFGSETVYDHKRHSTLQGGLMGEIEAIWKGAKSSPRRVRMPDLRRIQDGIFNLRTVAPPVPDGFYRDRREQFENQARTAAEQIWQGTDEATRFRPRPAERS